MKSILLFLLLTLHQLYSGNSGVKAVCNSNVPAGSYCPCAADTSSTCSIITCDAKHFCPGGVNADKKPCPPGRLCPAGVSAPQNCPEGKFCHDYLFISATSKNFTEARKSCRNLNLNLATINNQADIARFPFANNIWVGLSYALSNERFTSLDAWIWDSAAPYWESHFSVWIPGQPDFFNPQEFCVELAKYPNLVRGLNDVSCSDLKPFGCDIGSNVPIDCPAGFFCPTNTAYPYACRIGEFCPINTKLPQPCPSGHFCVNPAEKQPCPSGMYCPSGSRRPIPCPRGKLCSHTSDPVACPAGKRCHSYFGTNFFAPTYADADAYCKQFDTVLATIIVPNDFKKIDFSNPTPKDRYFIGLSTAFATTSRADWKWASGVPYTSTNQNMWHSANPSGDGSCGEVIGEFGTTVLNDLSCFSARLLLCDSGSLVAEDCPSGFICSSNDFYARPI